MENKSVEQSMGEWIEKALTEQVGFEVENFYWGPDGFRMNLEGKDMVSIPSWQVTCYDIIVP